MRDKSIVAAAFGVALTLGLLAASRAQQSGTFPSGGGGGSPGGANTQVQFNNSGSFGADSGLTYAGSGQITSNLGAITGTQRALNITGTFNNGAVTFGAPLLVNITETAALNRSLLFDVQSGGSSVFNVDDFGGLNMAAGRVSGTQLLMYLADANSLNFFNSPSVTFRSLADTNTSLRVAYGISLGNADVTAIDVALKRNAAGIAEVNSGTAGAFRDIKVRNLYTATAASPPALTSCGTSPAIASGSTDMAGEVTMGTGTPTGCVITFNLGPYAAAPFCTMSWQANLASMQYTISTTALTLTQTATSSNKVDYHCVQH